MKQIKDIQAPDPATTDELVAEFLTRNPQLASALATFDVAQEEYRKSLLAMTTVRVVTSGTTNIEV